MKKTLLIIFLALTMVFSLVACDNDASNESESLIFNSRGDGTCTVKGKPDSTETSVVVPATSPAGDTVVSVNLEGCVNVEQVTLPEGLESIAGFVFYETEALLELTIPASVNDINEDAFMYYPEDMVLTVAPDSYAQQWAAENEFAYIVAEPVAEAAN